MKCENGHDLAHVRCDECGRRCVVALATARRVASGQSWYICGRCVDDAMNMATNRTGFDAVWIGSDDQGDDAESVTVSAEDLVHDADVSAQRRNASK